MPDPEELLYPTKKDRVEDRRKEAHQRKLSDEFFDHATLLNVSRLITQGQFDQLDYPISTGKEGGVFRATCANGEFRAVKVYRIGNAVFRRIPPYVLEELLRETSAGNHARLVHAWTRREHSMLRKLRAAGVRCPEPYGYLRNVLVMEFVGTEGLPAPPLQEVRLDDPRRFYEALVVQIRRMVVDAGLCHGDLSPYNVLVDAEAPVLIDVAQSVAMTHPQAPALLRRDATHFAKFFARLGVRVTGETMLHEIGATPGPIPAEGR